MWIDLTFAVLAALAFYWGYSRGILRTVISLIAVFLGLILAVPLSEPIGDALLSLTSISPTALPLVSFILAFVLVILALRLLTAALERVLIAVRINFLNQLAGGVVSVLLITLVYSVLLTFIDSASLIPLATKAESITYDSLERFPDQAYAVLGKAKPALEQVRDRGREALQNTDSTSGG